MSERQTTLSFTPTHGLLTHFTPPILFGLAYHDPVQCLLTFFFGFIILPKFAARSLYLWSSPVFGGHSGRCPWYKPQLSIFPPQGSFTGRSFGDRFTNFLLWHPLFITSDRGSLAWDGAGTPVPCLMAAHTQGNTNL